MVIFGVISMGDPEPEAPEIVRWELAECRWQKHAGACQS
jgi:hypothetical protein